jgi:hypothetical protein
MAAILLRLERCLSTSCRLVDTGCAADSVGKQSPQQLQALIMLAKISQTKIA